MDTAAARAQRSSVDKFAARRRMLAESALTVLSERGFAHTGLRDIAEHSSLSHGTLHYYFDDKDELVSAAVWQYKSECARRYDRVVTEATSGRELVEGFGEVMVETLRTEGEFHRFWYDVRNQSLFDEGFRETVVAIDALLQEMVWAVVARYGELTGRTPTIEPAHAYALFDGLFLNALIGHLRGDEEALVRLRGDSLRLLEAAFSSAEPVGY